MLGEELTPFERILCQDNFSHALTGQEREEVEFNAVDLENLIYGVTRVVVQESVNMGWHCSHQSWVL